jgi:murein DD-endopeptidase MepM/ murein hydrolase activator NlpD
MLANDLTSSRIREGQRLLILPVSGVQHTVKSGQTMDGIARLYGVKIQHILEYNHFENVSKLAVGDQIFIPSELPNAKTVASASSKTTSTGKSTVSGTSLIGSKTSTKNFVDTLGYFIKPLVNYRKTQNLHGHNGIDLASKVGEPIMAAAAGEVLISRIGWNGGYGNYIVIQHNNGTQTVYGHANKLLVKEGEFVKQGQVIATVGSTGKSTGPHLHIEVRGGKNPF